ncbi:TPA: hypothetical protein SL252_003585 [Pseudomonas aeruginosa]|jgi:hypothetical protein|nr:hypothetical protein [Pseudomonas aeruginosa]
MSDVTRYNFDTTACWYEHPDGEFVEHDAYAKLAAEAQALREEVAKLRARVVPREVLERSIDRWACCAMSQTPGAEEAWKELRALLNQDKENGNG